ncbi:WG repeat-containing protein [Pasteurella skyensis]|uniref:WG repeat-containing protein n=1 Tax=Phocoenobacter skyensis TaxID=97481 RepID=A0AAJ6NEB8_9PAST|nr:WG repeat-containing protein [Pasteurella skyensis]MDP8170895.1 WG repeat-containing protein [Pasteurella skyensis]MDP8175267.1 WG repeat-containing protein [Pasteurella skyensis]
MKKYLLIPKLLLLWLVMATTVFAEPISLPYDDVDFYWDKVAVVQKNHKYGLMDMQGKALTEVKYDDFYWISEDLLAVKKAKFWGLLDIKGKELSAFKYDKIQILSCGCSNESDLNKNVLKAVMNGKLGLIDKKGKQITAFIYDKIDYFRDDFAKVTKGDQKGFLNKYYKEITGFKYPRIQRIKDLFIVSNVDHHTSKKGVLNANGALIYPVEYDDIKIFYSDFVAFRKGKLWGFGNNKGEIIVNTQFSYLTSFENNLFLVEKPRLGRGIINTLGKEIVSIKYDHYIRYLTPNRFIVSRNNKTYLIDDKHNIIRTFENIRINKHWWNYINIEQYQGDTLLSGVTDFNGNDIIPLEYTKIDSPKATEKVNIITVKTPQNKYGAYLFQHNKIEPLLSPIYDNLKALSEHYLLFEKDKVKGIMNSQGKVFVTDYDNAKSFDNYLAVSKNGLYGLFNVNAEQVVDYKYDHISCDRSGYIYIEKDGKKGALDPNFNIIYPPIYDTLYVHKNYVIFEKDGITGLGDLHGNITVYDKKYLYISDIFLNSDKYFIVTTRDYSTGLIDLYGNVLIKPMKKIDDIQFVKDNNSFYEIRNYNGKVGLIDLNGHILLKPRYSKISTLSPKRLCIYKHRQANIYDINSKKLIPTNYSYITEISDDLLIAETINRSTKGINYPKALLNSQGVELGKLVDTLKRAHPFDMAKYGRISSSYPQMISNRNNAMRQRSSLVTSYTRSGWKVYDKKGNTVFKQD